MKQTLFALSFLMLAAAAVATARQSGHSAGSTSAAITLGERPEAFAAAAESDLALQDDPAYGKYKEGYNAILEEKWSEAKKRLEALIGAYPKSEYRDDAEYWHAYAQMHLDRKQAIESYEKFIKNFPKSTYYDDAVSDLDQLNSGVTYVSGASGAKSVYVGRDGYGYTYSTDSADAADLAESPAPARATARQMRELSRDLQRVGKTLPRLPRYPFAAIAPMPGISTTVAGNRFSNEKLDPETQLKLDALYAIGDANEDEKSFQALKTVALDFSQPDPLRYAALDVVSDFEKFDVLSIYTEVARRDTNQEMQSRAIDYISNNSKDKNKSVQTLIDLFNGTPKSRPEQKRRVFFAIAEVGNDRAVDFLSLVARTNDNYDLRREAVYYLGTMGSEKARTALYDILQGKKER